MNNNTDILASFTKGLEFQVKRILRNGHFFVVEKPTPPSFNGNYSFAPRRHLYAASAISETLASIPFAETAVSAKPMNVERPHACGDFGPFDFPVCDWELCPAP